MFAIRNVVTMFDRLVVIISSRVPEFDFTLDIRPFTVIEQLDELVVTVVQLVSIAPYKVVSEHHHEVASALSVESLLHFLHMRHHFIDPPIGIVRVRVFVCGHQIWELLVSLSNVPDFEELDSFVAAIHVVHED